MNEDDKKRVLPISGLLLVLATLGFFHFAEIPFVGPRPQVSEIHDPTEMTKARLWQDPFRAVMDYHAKAGERRLSSRSAGLPLKYGSRFCVLDPSEKLKKARSSLREQIENRASEGRVTVLGVMVFGAPYAEETEDRVRRRYAVLTGLGKDYVPDDPEHIGFIPIDCETDEISMSNIMPFEWFSHRRENGKSARDSMLVLWINDDAFKGKPLSKLSLLVDRLGLKEGEKFKAKIDFKIIGPAGSTRLQEMLAELKTFGDSLAGLEIYSASATMDDDLLLKVIEEKDGNQRSVECQPEKRIVAKFKEQGIVFSRTIASDRALAEKLFEELKIRRVALGEKNDYIMLVGEWDTLYARSLLQIYQNVFREKGGGEDRLVRFHYMRGIDGSLPGKKEEKNSDKSESGGLDSKNVKQLEWPIGETQYDYLRRLADEACEFERQNLRPKGGSIKAIGVLGSDFYDKYLVLQALGQKFPDVLFFTTDLDARLLHPENIEWTRNLIVASSYGLKLQEEKSKEGGEHQESRQIPLSFRSNYQTSVFAATVQALAHCPVNQKNIAMQPRIFEIGHHSAVELLTEPTKSRIPGDLKATLRCGAIIAGIALSIFFLLYFSSHRFKNALKKVLCDHIFLTLTVAAVVLFYAGWLFYLCHSPGEEPFSLNEGISIWPTEILRMFAAFLSFFFLFYSSARLRENSQNIAKDFGLSSALGEEDADEASPGEDKTGKNGFRKTFRPMVKKFLDIVNDNWDIKKMPGSTTIAELWSEYLRRDSLRYRIVRLAPIIFFYLCLCFLILAFKMPETPVRGLKSWKVDKVTLVFSVVFFIILNFYVFDVTRTFRRFVTLAEKLPKWPRYSVKTFCSKNDFAGKVPTCPRSLQETMLLKRETQGDRALQEWMLILLIAIRTEVLGKLIFYPFIIWLIMFTSRIKYFDNWHMPLGLAIVISLGALYAWSSAFVLRRSAENARATTIQRLTEGLAHTTMEKAEGQGSVKLTEFVLSEVKSIRQGAFARFSQHPVLQALLIPFGGIGGVYLIDFLVKLNI